jgi:hypothetical protein
LLRPYYPVYDLYRLVREDSGLQADFMASIHGVRSFAALRGQSDLVRLGDCSLLVARLAAIVKSKRAAARPRDKAVLDILERALHEEEARRQKAKTRGAKERE